MLNLVRRIRTLVGRRNVREVRVPRVDHVDIILTRKLLIKRKNFETSFDLVSSADDMTPGGSNSVMDEKKFTYMVYLSPRAYNFENVRLSSGVISSAEGCKEILKFSIIAKI